LGRLLGQGPPDEVRRPLAENIYEEQTGKLSLGAAHPELFLEMMDGLGIPRGDVTRADGLEPELLAYRAWLDDVSARAPWVVGAAVLTIFVEGSVNERAELAGTRHELPVDEAIAAHSMVRHYGCPPQKMRLVRAHRAVEGGHRKDAWQMVLGHALRGMEGVYVGTGVEFLPEQRAALEAWAGELKRALDAKEEGQGTSGVEAAR
jgi:pyrroloquinoline-quinone synthase